MKFFNAIDRYIFRLVLMPMVGIFLLAASLLILDKMLRLFDFVAAEGGPVGVVFRLLANMLPEYASLAIPLGLMLGILLAFRKLATSSELDVMRAVGLSYTRLLRVPLILTVVMAGANLAIVGYLQPLSRYYYEELNYELKSGALGASIKVGEFTTLKDRIALRIDESQDDGRKLIGIFARVADKKGQVLSISARQGQFLALQGQPDTIIFRLIDGQIIQDEPGKVSRVLTFSRHDMPIDLPEVEKFRQRGGKDREYLLPELLRLSWNDALPKAERVSSLANFNYRMVEVIMMLMLPFLAVALAIPPKRSTSALGVFVSIVMVVAYHKVNEYAQDVATLGRVDPWVALWGPFVIFGILIAWMYYRVAYVPGGQAIGWLETASGRLVKRLKSLLRRKRRGPILPAPSDVH
ncbi:LPS export ABC transporter permease LptF [Novosphingobium colocasiae]|uniref:LPS export ABC transporter permease LptF n=1 Tax=Novosphingobium colocasiae TaxID=1256513 RepID=UPI0035B409AE